MLFSQRFLRAIFALQPFLVGPAVLLIGCYAVGLPGFVVPDGDSVDGLNGFITLAIAALLILTAGTADLLQMRSMSQISLAPASPRAIAGPMAIDRSYGAVLLLGLTPVAVPVLALLAIAGFSPDLATPRVLTLISLLTFLACAAVMARLRLDRIYASLILSGWVIRSVPLLLPDDLIGTFEHSRSASQVFRVLMPMSCGVGTAGAVLPFVVLDAGSVPPLLCLQTPIQRRGRFAPLFARRATSGA